MNPIVSVLIPTYNRKDLLKIALESVLAQDYPHLEIVVSDNASTDGTEEFVKSYNDSRIKYIKRSENIGAGRNFQEGFNDCTGKYFFCLNDDDFLTNKAYFSKVVHIMEENPNVSLVRSVVCLKKAKDNIFAIQSYDTQQLINGYKFFLNYYREGYENFICWFCCVRREPIAKAGGIQDHFAADVLMNLTACLHGDVYFLPEVSGQYTIWENQASDNLALMNTALDLPSKLEKMLSESDANISQLQIKQTVDYLGVQFIRGSMYDAYNRAGRKKDFFSILRAHPSLKTKYSGIYWNLMIFTSIKVFIIDPLKRLIGGIKASVKFIIKSLINFVLR